jgi:AcrR family transcriptional regulator
MSRSSDKRERLIDSADKLILRQGFKQTTLSDIAKDAHVPLGNVYYYFKTKEEIGETIVRTRIENTRQWLDTCAAESEPRDRLLKFLEHPSSSRAEIANNGCILGTLSYELRRSDSRLNEMSSSLINVIFEWAEQQFAAMGRSDAQDLALQFTSNLQGMCLISNALDNPKVIDSMVERTRKWLLSL